MFLELNDEFKQLCTDWQLRDGAPNDHTDATYDGDCATGSSRLHDASLPVIEAMAATVPRMARYSARLARAVERVADGETNRFTGVMCESYHDVWMELHEDLIVMLRIDRVRGRQLLTARRRDARRRRGPTYGVAKSVLERLVEM